MASTINASTTGGGGIVQTSDASGILQLQTAGTTAVTVDASQNVLVTGGGGLGYGTGSGGTVTQLTSRATAVTINKTTGAITMFSAAGSTAWNAFTVNNSTVASTDTVVVTSKGGATNSYIMYPVGISTGSFQVYFQTTGGTATDAPVINFTVIKGVTS